MNLLNEQMDRECSSSAARYGIILDASLITGVDPPHQIESALAAINTAHNEVSSDLSVAQALADQRIEESNAAAAFDEEVNRRSPRLGDSILWLHGLTFARCTFATIK